MKLSHVKQVESLLAVEEGFWGGMVELDRFLPEVTLSVNSEKIAGSQPPFSAWRDEKLARGWALAAIGVAVGLFVLVCVYYLSPLPVYDDYQAVLRYIDTLSRQHGVGAKLAYVLTAQHNEYKPVWSNAIEALQYWSSGQVNFRVLSVVGDLQVFGIAWLLWKNFADETIRGTSRLIFFMPVALVLFQVNYCETLNWSMPCLQNIGVLLFALFTLTMAAKSGRSSAVWSCVGLCMAIAASGNGFALFPIGILLFWQQRNWARAIVWTVLTALCAAGYAYHYTIRPKPPGTLQVAAGHHFHGLYILSFLGDGFGIALPWIRYLSIIAGVILVGIFVKAVLDRYYKVNPGLFAFMLFLLLTAFGVAAIRSGYGYDQSLSSRYKIYSDLLVICSYCFVLHSLKKVSVERRRKIFRSIYLFAIFFFLVNEAQGTRDMRGRYRRLQQGAALYHRSGHTQGPVAGLDPKATDDMNTLYRPLLIRAEQDGIYRLP